MNSFLDIAIEAAREGGAILLSEFSKPAKITYKGDISLVTQADGRSEAAVVAKLRSNFPKHVIVAEEGTGHEHLDASAAPGARYRWYVDPLDGTTNFAHGYPCFAVSIALVELSGDGAQEDLLAAAVFDPVRDELFTAAKGEGAFLNRKPIRVSGVEKLDASLLCTGFPPPRRSPNPNVAYYARFTTISHGVRRDGSAALDLCYIACGRFDGFWEFGLKPWDAAAGVLLVREAGGIATDIAGGPWRLHGNSILASNGRVHEEMRAVAADIAEKKS